ncbi:uncharacterized protein [Dermacentor andersoni]|uniref:uncharacterized protein n=1 Tax=Dermacentor andersoni TaxID=34620 RepID=UPI002155CB08|nr:zinc finger protein 845-like [Dermacentor andersoni]XP_054921334.1 zinc finger protein 845-like [Dermacentor andersoni]
MPNEGAEPPRCAVCGLQRAPNAVLLPFPDRQYSKLYGAWVDFVRGCPGKGNWLPDSRTGFVCSLHFTSNWLRRSRGSAHHTKMLLINPCAVPTLYPSPEQRRRIAEANSSSAAAARVVQGPNLPSFPFVPMNAKQFKPVGTDDTNKLSVSNGEGYSGIWDWKPDTCLTIDGYPAKPTGLPTLHLSQEHGFIAVASGRNTMDIKAQPDSEETVGSADSPGAQSLPDAGTEQATPSLQSEAGTQCDISTATKFTWRTVRIMSRWTQYDVVKVSQGTQASGPDFDDDDVLKMQRGGHVPVYASVRRTVGARRMLSEDMHAMGRATWNTMGSSEHSRPQQGVLTQLTQNLGKDVKKASHSTKMSPGCRDGLLESSDDSEDQETMCKYRLCKQNGFGASVVGNPASETCRCGLSSVDSSHQKKVYKCALCAYKCIDKEHLVVHMSRHTACSRPFKCEKCSCTFSRQVRLMLHMRTHQEPQETVDTSQQEEFKCDLCSETFASLGDLLEHVNIHENPVKCLLCPCTFTSEMHMKAHLCQHRGEKPFECSHIHLIQHTATHEKGFTCAVCSRTFSRKAGLLLHMRQHTGEKPYECRACMRTFTVQAGLKRHTRHHQNVVQAARKLGGTRQGTRTVGRMNRPSSASRHSSDLPSATE